MKSETLFTFPVHAEGMKQMQTIPDFKTGASCSQDSLCSNNSLNYSVNDSLMVSDKSNKSQIQFKSSSYEIKSSDIFEKKNAECFNDQKKIIFTSPLNKETSERISQSTPSRGSPLSPAIKNIGDQTVKAALIRTLITERLNSCSPVSWQT